MLKIIEELVSDDEKIKMIIKLCFFVQIDCGNLDRKQAVRMMTGSLLDYMVGEIASEGRETTIKLVEDISTAFSEFTDKELDQVRRFVGL